MRFQNQTLTDFEYRHKTQTNPQIQPSNEQAKPKKCQESRQRRRAVVPLLEVSHLCF